MDELRSNYSSEENDRFSSGEVGESDDSLDGLMRDYDGLSKTPPRTRIHRRLLKKRNISGHKICQTVKKYLPATSNSYRGSSEEDVTDSKKKTDKRSIHLLRHSERTFKLNANEMDGNKDEDVAKVPVNYCNFKVESSSRYLSLNCKLIKTVKQWRSSANEFSKSRSEFHEYIENLVKAGHSDFKEKIYKKQESQEQLWQTELKDMIWLELQARLSDRTVDQQDKYLLEARQSIPKLLEDILNYKFVKKQDKLSACSDDSGVYFPPSYSEEECPGCLSIFCAFCMEQEVTALKEVGDLLSRYEDAQALFPSSKSFMHLYPSTKSPEFYGKIKAMCVWYNMMRHFRLKTIILGKQILAYAEEGDLNENVYSQYEIKDHNYMKENEFDAIESLRHRFAKIFLKAEDGDTSTYRRYIEYVLKTNGLKKSFQFMEQLHNKLLWKAKIALEKPNKENIERYSSLDERILLQYGFWSDENLSMNLPCYRRAFLFLSRLPLDLVHEFLRMRLEHKLEKPSYLSIRQLMKELRDALKFAALNKQRYLSYCKVALIDYDEEIQNKSRESVVAFDKTVCEIMQLYLSYLEKWISFSQFGKFQKCVLDDEWKFITLIIPSFPHCEAKACDVFCKISCSVMWKIRSETEQNINLILKAYSEDYENDSCHNVTFSTTSPMHRKILHLCRCFQKLFIDTRDKTFNVTSLMKVLIKYFEEASNKREATSQTFLDCFKNELLNTSSFLRECIAVIENFMPTASVEDFENVAVQSRCTELVNQTYRYAFEYYKDVSKIMSVQPYLVQDMFDVAQNWLNFVKTNCEQGKGVRPRWINFGIEFILYISSQKFTKHLSDQEFEELSTSLKEAIDYIRGIQQTCSNSSSLSNLYYRHMSSASDSSIGSQVDTILDCTDKGKLKRQERLITAINKLEETRESKLREEELIGSVSSTSSTTNYDKKFIKPRSVTFKWQRGIKIGQGRFGKVYTAVNNDTGELMAMKEIPLSPNDVKTIRNVATELKIFEGIQQDNLVRYYGAEIHRDELLIFMELCPEGTLEELIMASENGLPESIVRRFTKQLISAVATLHEHSIVHRDIKTANIFLTAEGNKLKLGDFGSAVKIRAHTTAPGELKGFVGTQAYMAPEVFMKTNTVGHGRAADIWSLGCVVIEMASGKRPWSEFDSNYQIMFKVGMGETPDIPDSLSEEGKSFISKCIQHNPKRRATINQLKSDNFLKVESEDDAYLTTMPSALEECLKLGIKCVGVR